MAERIVVVGHAAVTCLGRDIDATWRGLIAGRSGLRRQEILPPEHFLQDVAGIVADFGPDTPGADPALAKLGARSVHLAMAAARAAWADAGLDRVEVDRHRASALVGSAVGGLDRLGDEFVESTRRDYLQTSQYLISDLILNQAGGQVAQHLGLYGPSIAPAAACASGGHAISLGAMLLRADEIDVAVCGASDSAFTPLWVNGLVTMRAILPRRPDDRSAGDPSQASRPFSIDRAGFILAEGAGMLVLVTETTARRLGLRVQAELAGWALNTDGHHMTRPHAARIVRCLADALRRAGVDPERVDYYNAHGTSTPVNDRTETEAIKEVFGPHARRLPVSSIKGALGHSMGAASAIEAAVCIRALRDQVIPPTINYEPDPELDLDYVPHSSRALPVETVLSAAFGFGGINNALVLRRWSDAA